MGSPLVMLCATAAPNGAATTPIPSPKSRAKTTTRRNPIPPTQSRKQGFHKIDHFEINQVIPSGKQHQAENEGETDLEPQFLYPLAERAAAYALDRVIGQMAAVEHWNREQVDES